MRLDSVTLTQQKSEKVPRMSGEELLALLGIDSEIRRRKNRFDQCLRHYENRWLVLYERDRQNLFLFSNLIEKSENAG